MGTGFLPFLYNSPASSDTCLFFTRMTTTPSGINVKLSFLEGPCLFLGLANGDRSHALAFLKRSAFEITETDERLIARAAMSGLNNHPVGGYSTPAASGIPNAL